MGIRSVALAAAGMLFFAQALAEPAGTTRLIIKLRPAAGAEAQATNQKTAQSASQSGPGRARRLVERTGLPLSGARDLGSGMVGIALRAPLAGDTLDATLAALRADPDIEFAEVDQRRYARALPSDPLYISQWYQQGVETAATHFEAAWDTTTGAADTVIAVLDSGIRFEHPDLTGRVLAGYDFVSGESGTSFVAANDGNDWDADASDPGDWLSSADLDSGALAGCRQVDPEPSSWHGTRVAAMIAATTNNDVGVAGSTWSGSVLPVRVLGKCGGFDSDIVAGMRWAAGLPVAGVPMNPAPATVLNMSLGGVGSCGSAYRNVLTELTAAGVVVVISAGNDNGPVDSPANCPGALAVGGLRHVGTKSGFGNVGPEVGISAPAGNCPDVNTTFLCSYSLIAATNTGLTVPVSSTYTDEVNYSIGTSFSAPIVSAVAGLMYGVNDELTTAELITRIKTSARPFPAPDAGIPTCPAVDLNNGQCNCTTSTCGAGIADAPGAVAEALRPMARIVAPAGAAAGQNVTLNGGTSGAARNRTVASYAWTGVSGNPAFVGATNVPNATVAMPVSGQVRVRLAVTDDLGRTDTSEVTLGVVAGGGGGGGAFHPLMLLALGLLLGRRLFYR